MDLKERRALLRAKMNDRHEEAYRRKDDSGKFRSIFENKIPLEKRFKCGEGDHSLDFVPYLAGKHDPHVKEGNRQYCLDLWIHRKVGVSEDDFVCLKRNGWGECPICDYQAHLKKEGETDEAIIKSLNPTRRCIYNVWCHDTPKEEAKGVQIWDVSQYAFDSLLSEQAKKKKGGGYIYFSNSDAEEGKTVSFRRTGMGPTNTKYVAFSFEDRESALPDEIIDQSQCLDDLIHIPSYDEVYEAFFGQTRDGKKDEEAPSTERRRPDAREPEPEPEDVGDPCPSGFHFGEDFGQYDECDDCDLRKDCRAEKRGLNPAPALEPVREPEPVREAPAPSPTPVMRRRRV